MTPSELEDARGVRKQIRPCAFGQSILLFAGSLRFGKRAAAFMRPILLARMNGYDPYAKQGGEPNASWLVNEQLQ